jgi:hypothetical protein
MINYFKETELERQPQGGLSSYNNIRNIRGYCDSKTPKYPQSAPNLTRAKR